MSDAAASEPQTDGDEPGSSRVFSAGAALAGLLVALFVIGLVGWLVQGAGSDESVPTVPFTAAPAPPPVVVTALPVPTPAPPPSTTP